MGATEVFRYDFLLFIRVYLLETLTIRMTQNKLSEHSLNFDNVQGQPSQIKPPFSLFDAGFFILVLKRLRSSIVTLQLWFENCVFLWQECETKIAQEIASLSKEDVSKEEMNENEEVINILLAQVDGKHGFVCWYLLVLCLSGIKSK